MPSSLERHAEYMREIWYPANREKQKAAVRRNERRLRKAVNDEKDRRGGCEECGYDAHPSALDFHHREGSEKVFSIAVGVHRGLGLSRIIAEMAKCSLLCANCHRVHHHA